MLRAAKRGVASGSFLASPSALLVLWWPSSACRAAVMLRGLIGE
jgi:hypothetical protein